MKKMEMSSLIMLILCELLLFFVVFITRKLLGIGGWQVDFHIHPIACILC
jgi:hypothetical protein